MGCDTLVAMAPATRDGITLFAKNSDRPPRECQRAVQLPLTPAVVRTILRDHYASGTLHTQKAFDDPQFFSLCMHADPLDNTTAAMVASRAACRRY